jgi:hypothetical protein
MRSRLALRLPKPMRTDSHRRLHLALLPSSAGLRRVDVRGVGPQPHIGNHIVLKILSRRRLILALGCPLLGWLIVLHSHL